jgi:hypothetical protein
MIIDIVAILYTYITYPISTRFERLYRYNLLYFRKLRLSGAIIVDGFMTYYRDSYGISRNLINTRRYKYNKLHGVCKFANEFIVYKRGLRHLFAYIPCHNPRYDEYELYIYYNGYELKKIECYSRLL